MTIRKAEKGEDLRVLSFYHDLIDRMQGREYCPYWTKGVYPVLEDIHAAIEASSMYIALEEDVIVGAFITNHSQGDGYDRVQWRHIADPDRVAVIHLIAVDPDIQGRGIGKRLLRKAVDVSRARGDAVIRLDTLTWNLPGRRMYEGFGFDYVGDYDQTYPTTGTIPFSMYELEV